MIQQSKRSGSGSRLGRSSLGPELASKPIRPVSGVAGDRLLSRGLTTGEHAATLKGVRNAGSTMHGLNKAATSMMQQANSMPVASGNLAPTQQLKNHKLRKQDEGFESLPEDFKLDLELEDAEKCFSCHKTLARKFGGIMKKGRHHCKRCARTVCDRCRQNKRRLSKQDKQEQLVCDQCDFELGNPQAFQLRDRIRGMQDQVTAQLTQRNTQLDKEARVYRDTKRDL